jgi:hypothetical protein
MIVRIWHGKTSSADAEAYMNYVIQTVLKTTGQHREFKRTGLAKTGR